MKTLTIHKTTFILCWLILSINLVGLRIHQMHRTVKSVKTLLWMCLVRLLPDEITCIWIYWVGKASFLCILTPSQWLGSWDNKYWSVSFTVTSRVYHDLPWTLEFQAFWSLDSRTWISDLLSGFHPWTGLCPSGFHGLWGIHTETQLWSWYLRVSTTSFQVTQYQTFQLL